MWAFKKYFFIVFFFTALVKAQVGIGTVDVHKSAILELKSTTSGFIPPRLADPFVIDAPETGLMIYNTTENCLQINKGTPQLPLWTCIGSGDVLQNFILKENIGTTEASIPANTKQIVPGLTRSITVPAGGKRYLLVNANIPVNTTGPSTGILELNGIPVASQAGEASTLNNHIKMIDLVTYLELDPGTHTLEVHVLAGENGVSVNLPITHSNVDPVKPNGELIIGKAEMITLESSTSLGLFTTKIGSTELTINAGTEALIPGLTHDIVVPPGQTHYVTVNVDIPILDNNMSTVLLNVNGTPVMARTGNSSLFNNKAKSVSFQKYLELESGSHTLSVSVFAGPSNAIVNMSDTDPLVASLVPAGQVDFAKGKLQILDNNLSWNALTNIEGTMPLTISANMTEIVPGMDFAITVLPGEMANLMFIIDIPVTSASPSTAILRINNTLLLETATDEAQENNNALHSINFKRGVVLPAGSYTFRVEVMAGDNDVIVNPTDANLSVSVVKPSNVNDMGKARMQVLHY